MSPAERAEVLDRLHHRLHEGESMLQDLGKPRNEREWAYYQLAAGAMAAWSALLALTQP